MKDYMFLFIGGHENMKELSPEQMQAHMGKWTQWISEMSQQGIFKAGNPLDGEGKTLSGAEKLVTDRPLAEAKELVGGFIIIEADSLDSATEVAKGCPIFENGGRVEVRAIREMDHES